MKKNGGQKSCWTVSVRLFTNYKTAASELLLGVKWRQGQPVRANFQLVRSTLSEYGLVTTSPCVAPSPQVQNWRLTRFTAAGVYDFPPNPAICRIFRSIGAAMKKRGQRAKQLPFNSFTVTQRCHLLFKNFQDHFSQRILPPPPSYFCLTLYLTVNC